MAVETLEKYDTVRYEHTAAVVAKYFYVFNSTVMMALNAALANVETAFVNRCAKIRVTKQTGQAWTAGQLVYLAAGTQTFTTVSTANELAGYVAGPAASGDTEGLIDLDPAAV